MNFRHKMLGLLITSCIIGRYIGYSNLTEIFQILQAQKYTVLEASIFQLYVKYSGCNG